MTISARCMRRPTWPAGLLQYDGTIGDSAKQLAGLPLLFNPGENGNTASGVDVLGRLIEVCLESLSTNSSARESSSR